MPRRWSVSFHRFAETPDKAIDAFIAGLQALQHDRAKWGEKMDLSGYIYEEKELQDEIEASIASAGCPLPGGSSEVEEYAPYPYTSVASGTGYGDIRISRHDGAGLLRITQSSAYECDHDSPSGKDTLMLHSEQADALVAAILALRSQEQLYEERAIESRKARIADDGKLRAAIASFHPAGAADSFDRLTIRDLLAFARHIAANLGGSAR